MLPGLEGDRGARRHANARVLTAPPAPGPPRPDHRGSAGALDRAPWTGADPPLAGSAPGGAGAQLVRSVGTPTDGGSLVVSSVKRGRAPDERPTITRARHSTDVLPATCQHCSVLRGVLFVHRSVLTA